MNVRENYNNNDRILSHKPKEAYCTDSWRINVWLKREEKRKEITVYVLWNHNFYHRLCTYVFSVSYVSEILTAKPQDNKNKIKK